MNNQNVFPGCSMRDKKIDDRGQRTEGRDPGVRIHRSPSMNYFLKYFYVRPIIKMKPFEGENKKASGLRVVF